MSEEWVVLEVVGTEEEADLISGFLEANGVPSEVESVLSHEFPSNFGALGEVRILVHEAQREEAERVLAARRAGEPSEEGSPTE